MTPVIIVRLIQTTFSDILWPFEIKQTDRCHRDREDESDRQADRQTGRTVGWCLTRSDLETSQLGGNCQTLAGSCWLIWAVMEKKIPRELRGSERGRKKDRRGREESSKTWRGVKKEKDGGQTIHCYVLDIFLMIFIQLIHWCRSSNTPASTVDSIEIELNRTTEEQIESGILKDKADGIERLWWKEDGCKKMERCETKKGQSIWREEEIWCGECENVMKGVRYDRMEGSLVFTQTGLRFTLAYSQPPSNTCFDKTAVKKRR